MTNSRHFTQFTLSVALAAALAASAMAEQLPSKAQRYPQTRVSSPIPVRSIPASKNRRQRNQADR